MAETEGQASFAALPAELNERFQKMELLGEGRLGFVVRVNDRTNNDLAMKIAYKSPQIVKYAENEVEILKKIAKHEPEKNFCLKMLEHFHVNLGDHEEDSRMCITSKMHGQSLQTFLSDLGENSLEMSQAKRIFYELFHAVGFLHLHHVIHCDINPKNVVFAFPSRYKEVGNNVIRLKKPEIRLIDFGSAYDDDDHNAHKQNYIGTPAYMSPEMLVEMEWNNHADIWAVGCTMFEFFKKTKLFKIDEELDPWADTSPASATFHLALMEKLMGKFNKDMIFRNENRNVKFIRHVDRVDTIRLSEEQMQEIDAMQILSQWFLVSEPDENDLYELLKECLELNKILRINAVGALKHGFFKNVKNKPPLPGKVPTSFAYRSRAALSRVVNNICSSPRSSK